jgi:tripartite-type tricarboxylate transporter receptor subunit TctC
MVRRLPALFIALVLLIAGDAFAQPYPEKPVRVVVPLSTGSSSDALARYTALRLTELWKQQVVVENAPGANGMTGAAIVAKAAPDGYTLMIMANNHIVNPSLHKSMPFDAIRDFTWISNLANAPIMLVANGALPVRSLNDLVAYAKTRPQGLSYGSPGSGSSSHLAMELVRLNTGMNLVHVPYKAVSQAQTDLISGQLQTMFMVPITAIPQAQAGRLHILAAAGGRRFSQLPEVPTLAEAGLKGFDVSPWVGMMGPAGMRADLVRRISGDVARVLGTEEARQRALALGLEIALMGHDEFEKFIARDKDHWAELVRRSGAKVD